MEMFEEFCNSRTNYRFRIVTNLGELIEKIKILEGGLDDRAIEWIKYHNVRMFHKVNEEPSTDKDDSMEFMQPRFQGRVRMEEKECLFFHGPVVLRLPGMPPMPASVSTPLPVYERAVQHLDMQLPWPKPVRGKCYLINQKFVEEKFDTLPSIFAKESSDEKGE
jgi:hypothetical protein